MKPYGYNVSHFDSDMRDSTKTGATSSRRKRTSRQVDKGITRAKTKEIDLKEIAWPPRTPRHHCEDGDCTSYCGQC